MPSKRASAIKAAKESEAMADRMEAIERNQFLIMKALGIVPSDETDSEAVVADDATGDSPEGEADAGKEKTVSKPAPKKKTTTKK